MQVSSRVLKIVSSSEEVLAEGTHAIAPQKHSQQTIHQQ